MKQTLLQVTTEEYSEKLKRQILFCVACSVFAAVINVVFTLLRNEKNHTLMLALNIIVDIIAAWFIFGYVNLIILPKRRLLSLAESKNHLTVTGIVKDIERDTVMVDKLECTVVTVDGDDIKKVFVATNSGIALNQNQKVTLSLHRNIVINAEVE